MPRVQQGYCLVHLIDEPTDQTFKDWGRHLTIVPWFTSTEDLLRAGRKAVAEVAPVRYEGSGLDQFGPLEVTLVEATNQLKTLHGAALKSAALVVAPHARVRKDYTPHVTTKKSIKMSPGAHTIHSLHLVQADGDMRTIIAEWSLAKPKRRAK